MRLIVLKFCGSNFKFSDRRRGGWWRGGWWQSLPVNCFSSQLGADAKKRYKMIFFLGYKSTLERDVAGTGKIYSVL